MNHYEETAYWSDDQRQKREQEEQMWREHMQHVRELEKLLDNQGVKHRKVKG